MWLEWMQFAEQIYLAGLKSRLKPGETLQDAVRKDYARWAEQHDRKLRRMMERLDAAERSHGE